MLDNVMHLTFTPKRERVRLCFPDAPAIKGALIVVAVASDSKAKPLAKPSKQSKHSAKCCK
jgi:hypothetical protein